MYGKKKVWHSQEGALESRWLRVIRQRKEVGARSHWGLIIWASKAVVLGLTCRAMESQGT